jgi:hypothetical protein
METNCRSGLAREGAITFKINIESHTAIAGKPARGTLADTKFVYGGDQNMKTDWFA